MAVNTIFLKGCGYHLEKVAQATIKPGYLLQLNSYDKVIPHNAAGGQWTRMIAKEDALQGNTTANTYASGDVVMIHQAIPGDVVQMRIPVNAATVAIGDKVMSNGDGTVIIFPSNGSKLYSNSAISSSITNTNAETAFSLSYTIPANFLKAGDIIRVRALARTPNTNSTDAFTLKVKLGSTVIGSTTAAGVDVADGDGADVNSIVLFTAIGGTGSFMAGGTGVCKTSSLVTATAATTADTTGTLAITATGTWTVASASNVAYLEILEVVIDRQGDLFPVALVTEAVTSTAAETLFSALVI